MVDLSAVQNVVAAWWFDYDQGNIDTWPGYFTPDAHFSCRSNSGKTAFEEFIRADVTSGDAIVAWQIDHRGNSPYPLRHNATNIHLAASGPTGAAFRSYLFVTHIVGGAVSNLASGICTGTVREHAGAVRFADLRVVLDFTDSVTFSVARR